MLLLQDKLRILRLLILDLLNNTGNLNNTASFGTPANTARITIGILDMPQNENAGNAYDTGNTRIDRRGNAVDNTSTSAEKLQDNFTFYFYRRRLSDNRNNSIVKR